MKRLLVISAHAADFVWRAGGAIALTVAQGGEALVVALSYGERGESGELWKEPGQTLEQVKAIRETEAKQAAEVLGARFVGLDLGDYPLSVDEKALWRLVDILSARALVSQHGVPKSGLWKGFSGAPTAAKAAVVYLAP